MLVAVTLASFLALQPGEQPKEPVVAKELYQYVIYNKPKDHPHLYVVRKWIIGPGTAKPGEMIGVAETLDKARKLVPEGLHCIPRYPNDDPVIEEVWM